MWTKEEMSNIQVNEAQHELTNVCTTSTGPKHVDVKTQIIHVIFYSYIL